MKIFLVQNCCKGNAIVSMYGCKHHEDYRNTKNYAAYFAICPVNLLQTIISSPSKKPYFMM